MSLMKVFIWPSFGKEVGQGGIKRVTESLYRWLPEYGVEIVDDIKEADLVNVHADELKTDLPIAASLHGLYWNGYPWENWCYEANDRLIRVAKKAQSVSVPSQWVAHSMRRGMLLDPFVLMHGINLDEWEPAKSQGYVYFDKTRIDPICEIDSLNILTGMSPNVQFLSTFGNADLPNLTLTGRVPYPQAKENMRRAGVYFASTMETGGISIMEAMASGVPCLGFDHGAASEIITHGETGYLVEPGDYQGLFEGLMYCLSYRERLGEAARQYIIEHHQWKDQIADYVPFYRRALEGSSRTPKVSVIVTAYNLEQYLPACLDSLLRQDMTDWECLIVDDASPDRCGEIADDYAKRDSRIQVIHNTSNAYLAEARNIGIRASRGQYILCLDADDELAGHTLRIFSEALDRDRNVDIATGGFRLVEPDGRVWDSQWPPAVPSYNQQIKSRNQVFYASMYRRWVWERTGGYRRRWQSAEDAEFWARAMSYGAVPAKVTDEPTLIYNNRPESMSHSIPTPDWTSWLVHAQYPQFTPFGASGDLPKGLRARPVAIYGPPKLSVVIPCGPGHEGYLQDSLDSIVAQTFQDWELIVVNDTGTDISQWVQGFPFAKVIDSHGPVGVAAARNLGIAQAKAECFVLLDADDYAQPLLLDLLYGAWKKYGGWIYTDWYDQDGQEKQAQEFSSTELLKKMPGPSTGIYSKHDWEVVGGFDEEAPGWEDWIAMIALFSIGSCGSRLAYHGFTYRYLAGTRRETDFANQKELLQYIQKKFRKLYTDGEYQMACGKCGKGGGKITLAAKLQSAGVPDAEMIEMEYVGLATQNQRIKSVVNRGELMIFSAERRRFFAYRADAERLINNTNFRMVGAVPGTQKVVEEAPVLISHTKPLQRTLEMLDLDNITESVLKKNGYNTVDSLVKAPDSALLALKGMGSKRVAAVREAIHEL